MITITKELLEEWGVSDLIPDELLPMDVMRLFEAPIPPEDKIELLLREGVLGRRGLVYMLARVARRGCTKTGWNHPDTLRALDLCDRYAEGEAVSKEELERAAKAAWEVLSEDAPSMPAWRAAHRAALVTWAARDADVTATDAVRGNAWASVEAVVRATSSEAREERSQLADCREWLLRNSPQEKAPVLTRYQRIMRSLS
jgi:hypothetical protein